MPDEHRLPPVVVKLGGSLLDIEDLAARLRGLFLSLAPAPVALVVGGGPAADLVRKWDQRFALGDDAAHWLAIRAMRLTEALVVAVVPELRVVETRSQVLRVLHEGRCVVLSLESLLREAAGRGEETPQSSWEVTSDTLAAWATRSLGAERLVLAKSIDAPAGGLEAAVAAGLVDLGFRDAARNLEVGWVNLRAGGSQASWLNG